tara:strand:- start:340 stop:2337 length:1998 start_codon:yes stop_codon:yes gene_type:complete
MKSFGNQNKTNKTRVNITKTSLKDDVFKKAIICHSQGEIEEAFKSYKQLINEGYKNPLVYLNYGSLLKHKGKLKEAENFTRKAIEIKPDYAMAYSNLGGILNQLGKLEEAEIYVRKAINNMPNYGSAYTNLGSILIKKGNYKEAEIYTRKAIKINPKCGVSYSNLGAILLNKNNIDDAEIYTRKSIRLMPCCANSFCNLGQIFRIKKKYNEAIEYFKKAIELQKDFIVAQTELVWCEALVCEWSNPKYNLFFKRINNNDALNPWVLMTFEDDPIVHFQRALNFSRNFQHVNSLKMDILNKKNRRIRIGYFSCDFYNHATMHLIIRLFELHKKSDFEVFVYNLKSKIKDDFTKRIIKSADRYRNVEDLSDSEIVNIARDDKLDIAIDLKGYTKHSRMSIFANRVAPIQISYLGYPGTTGLKSIDYIIADKTVIPSNNKQYFSEKIIYMPNCYQCNNDTKKIFDNSISFSETMIPENKFVYTCFNSNYKITPREFDIWMRLLLNKKDSILWLIKSNDQAEINLRREAEKRNVDPSRLIFAKHIQLEKHLARHQYGDLALDTFNVNGHTTSSDALWSGLPLLTMIGKSFTARVSASLLNSLGINELITNTEIEYEEKANELAHNSIKLAKIKENLIQARATSSLFNTSLFVLNYEKRLKELIKSHGKS